MTKVAILILGVSMMVLGLMWLIALTAPIGYEDEDGFHMGDREDD